MRVRAEVPAPDRRGKTQSVHGSEAVGQPKSRAPPSRADLAILSAQQSNREASPEKAGPLRGAREPSREADAAGMPRAAAGHAGSTSRE